VLDAPGNLPAIFHALIVGKLGEPMPTPAGEHQVQISARDLDGRSGQYRREPLVLRAARQRPGAPGGTSPAFGEETPLLLPRGWSPLLIGAWLI
jgi:hypothetical protein